jgi:hypothetical protein
MFEFGMPLIEHRNRGAILLMPFRLGCLLRQGPGSGSVSRAVPWHGEQRQERVISSLHGPLDESDGAPTIPGLLAPAAEPDHGSMAGRATHPRVGQFLMPTPP